MDLKTECGKLNIKIADLVESSGTPYTTLRDWSIKHPKRIDAFFDAIRFRQLKTGDSHLQRDLLN